MRRSLVIPVMLIATGCGPSRTEQRATELRERTLSIVNTEADRWGGGKSFATQATDAWGRLLMCRVEKRTINNVLEIRSAGPDGLPKNSDDVVVTRTKPHGETTLTKEAAKVVEDLTESAGSGTIKGIKKGLRSGAATKKN